MRFLTLLLPLALAACAMGPGDTETFRTPPPIDIDTDDGETPAEPADADPPVGGGSSALDSEDPRVLEVEFLRLINAERMAGGLLPLAVYWELSEDALLWTETMQAADELSHNPDLARIAPSAVWIRLGENVGVGPSVAELHDAFMDSDAHRDNILGEYDYAGVGVVRATDEPIWVTVNFMESDVAGLDRHLPPFRDDEGSTHEANIQKIYDAGITVGCNPAGDRYCPADEVTRAQMAAFLTRALSLPAASRDYFVDDDTGFASYEASINAIAEAGITVGCNSPVGDRFCPGDSVTRAQMAVFLTRAFDLPPSTVDHFVDDSAITWAEPSINAIADERITHGCNPPVNDRYCPNDPVTREQMASFLARALGL